ncbi:MAG: glycogen/starch/alpha-glucan phosphorylase [Clostridia bacterium]
MIDCSRLMQRIEDNLMSDYQISLHEADAVQLHNAVGNAVFALTAESRKSARQNHEMVRRAYYFSAEYLVGRMVFNNLYSLGILDKLRPLLLEKGVDINSMEDIEDIALGNGGLGRLAACYLDSSATHAIPLDGYGLRYRFGLFKQSFKNGFQSEKADDWSKFGDPWSKRRDDKTVTVEFADKTILAVPYDMPIFGYKTENVSILRLWQSEALEEFDFSLFNDQEYALAVREKNAVEDITRVLYPNDSTYNGKILRLKQQYFLASASIQDILRRYRRIHGSDFSNFSLHAAIQLNDTHPTVAIPELIRLLMLEGLDFSQSFDISRKTFCYTNHTIMSEALEKWDVNLFKTVLPKILEIIYLINNREISDLKAMNKSQETIDNMLIVKDGTIHMARLASFVSTKINGVAKIHTELLKTRVLKDFYECFPERFINVTNGISQRRWLGLSNPEYTALLSEKIGTDKFLLSLSEIHTLTNHLTRDTILRFIDIKNEKKRQLSDIINKKEGVYLPPNFIFDVQVKRMHEYKRQLMNAFSILDIYYSILDGTLKDFTPTAFIFGAKAAPGYARAKGIIKFINEVAKLINNDSAVNLLMRVVFVQNYNCSYAEHIIPAADISEQISPAGTEASGTGNMKLMLNGAVTLGTWDGATIEIIEQAGAFNNYVFGASIDELNKIRDSYSPKSLYDSNYRIRRVVDTLINGVLSDNETGVFKDIYDSLLYGDGWNHADGYFVLYDLISYIETKLKAINDYKNLPNFATKCLLNTASAGIFSSDRAVLDYAHDIWGIEKF